MLANLPFNWCYSCCSLSLFLWYSQDTQFYYISDHRITSTGTSILVLQRILFVGYQVLMPMLMFSHALRNIAIQYDVIEWQPYRMWRHCCLTCLLVVSQLLFTTRVGGCTYFPSQFAILRSSTKNSLSRRVASCNDGGKNQPLLGCLVTFLLTLYIHRYPKKITHTQKMMKTVAVVLALVASASAFAPASKVCIFHLCFFLSSVHRCSIMVCVSERVLCVWNIWMQLE